MEISLLKYENANYSYLLAEKLSCSNLYANKYENANYSWHFDIY